MPDLLRSVVLFVAAGLCEIGDGYLVWLWASRFLNATVEAISKELRLKSESEEGF
ncbi:MAG TPA: hypothetical protein VKW78_22855 [Terriglobales bacterium]|nr:hypothetical protein [Terriglobales bacterium]